MILRGNMIDGAEALRIGLVDHLVGPDAPEVDFEALVADYGRSNSAGCRYAKALLPECFDSNFGHFFAAYLAKQRRALDTPDFSEAMAAYRENRPAVWR